MYYLGSKADHAADIVAIATAKRKHGQTWVEPFVGGGNVICRVDGSRIGSDVNWRMIELLDAVGNRGWIPPEQVTKEEYEKIKNNQDSYPPELVAFVATGCTFGSKWFGGYAQNDKGHPNRAQSSSKYALLDAPKLRGVKFMALRYTELTPHIPPESIVYCDPPYAGTTGYGGAKTEIDVGQDLSINVWNRGKFWKWADKLVDAGHSVFVSEYMAPSSVIYDGLTPELKRERDAYTAEGKRIDMRNKIEREALRLRIADVEGRIKAVRDRLAARWESVWEKEVVSDFDPERGSTHIKRNIEKLFHRRP